MQDVCGMINLSYDRGLPGRQITPTRRLSRSRVIHFFASDAELIHTETGLVSSVSFLGVKLPVLGKRI